VGKIVRNRPALFRALGRLDPPAEVQIDGQTLRRASIFKHDSWAATARYRGAGRDVVCKFNRVQPIPGLPIRHLGQWLARREALALARLAGVEGIPRLCGPVHAAGRRLTNAVAHDFIHGHPMAIGERPDDRFFPRLRELLAEVHARHIAYVDLHKRENVVVGDDGRPYLVDFQVCYGLWHPHMQQSSVMRRALATLQRMDMYSFTKHVGRQRADQFSLIGCEKFASRPWWINAHRGFAVPLRQLRRRLLTVLQIRSNGKAMTEAFPEDAIRRELQAAV
jgi:hypothetical protein